MLRITGTWRFRALLARAPPTMARPFHRLWPRRSGFITATSILGPQLCTKMAARPHFSSCRQRGAALIIVLAFVVLLTGLLVAYMSRATSDRTVAQSSLHQTKVDQVAASGMDLVIGALRQEITGPPPTPTPPYVPAANANMLPLRFDNPPASLAAIPNLVRRSLRADNTIPAPGISSLA